MELECFCIYFPFFWDKWHFDYKLGINENIHVSFDDCVLDKEFVYIYNKKRQQKSIDNGLK